MTLEVPFTIAANVFNSFYIDVRFYAFLESLVITLPRGFVVSCFIFLGDILQSPLFEHINSFIVNEKIFLEANLSDFQRQRCFLNFPSELILGDEIFVT